MCVCVCVRARARVHAPTHERVSFCCFYRQCIINNLTDNIHITSDRMKMQAIMTNCLVTNMPIELVTSTPQLNSSAQKNHSSGSLTLMNINIKYVKHIAFLINSVTISL